MNNVQGQLAQTPIKVLVAEDNLMNQKVIQVLLRKEGYEVNVVPNGKEALLALEQNSFDGLILDYQMPELDGLQTLKVIRQHKNESIRQMQVIFLTAEINQAALGEIELYGVTEILPKPLDPKKLVETVAQFKRLPTAQTPTENKLTTGYLYEITDGNLTVMLELIGIFMEEAPLALQKINASYTAGDFPALLKTIHKIRSNFKYLGQLAIEKLLADLEQDITQNRNPQTYQDRIQVIEGLTRSFLETLTREKQLLQKNTY